MIVWIIFAVLTIYCIWQEGGEIVLLKTGWLFLVPIILVLALLKRRHYEMD